MLPENYLLLLLAVLVMAGALPVVPGGRPYFLLSGLYLTSVVLEASNSIVARIDIAPSEVDRLTKNSLDAHPEADDANIYSNFWKLKKKSLDTVADADDSTIYRSWHK